MGDVVGILHELRWGEIPFANLRYKNYSDWCAVSPLKLMTILEGFRDIAELELPGVGAEPWWRVHIYLRCFCLRWSPDVHFRTR